MQDLAAEFETCCVLELLVLNLW